MKVKTTKTETVEVELPQYFEWLGSFAKCLRDGLVLVANNNDLDDVLGLNPSIQVHNTRYYSFDLKRIKPITKEAFDLAFLQAERKLNDLRK